MFFRFNSLKVRLAILVGGLSLLVGASIIYFISDVASARMTQASGERLQSMAKAVSYALAANLRERDREITLLAQSPEFRTLPLNSPVIRERLSKTKQSYQHYAWIGAASSAGKVEAAAGGLLEGEDVSARPWFKGASSGSFIGDIHEAVLLSKHFKLTNAAEPLRFVDFAAPILDTEGRLRGVLGSHAHWSWVDGVVKGALGNHVVGNGIEIMVLGQNHDVLYPFSAVGSVTAPASLPVGDYSVLAWPSGGVFLTTAFAIDSGTRTNLGWMLVVRQPISLALADVTQLHVTLWGVGGVATAIFMLAIFLLVSSFTRPLETLAHEAQKLADGTDDADFNIASETAEISTLSGALKAMTAKLLDQKQRLQAALGEQQELNSAVIESTSNGILLYRNSGACLLANQAAAKIIGTGAEALLQQNFHHIESWKTCDLYTSALHTLATGNEHKVLFSTLSTFGKPIDSEVNLTVLHHGAEQLLLLVMKDVSELVKANRELEQLARHDPLTGLHNRLALNERLRSEFMRMKRTGNRYTILMADLDHFKQINDSYGHETGDAVLQVLGDALKTCARSTDFTSRYGGEEFLIILPDTDQQGAGAVAEKIRLAVENASVPVVQSITVSIGVAEANPLHDTEDLAVSLADLALYQAKANGRNRVEVSNG